MATGIRNRTSRGFIALLARFRRDENGATTIEFAVLAGMGLVMVSAGVQAAETAGIFRTLPAIGDAVSAPHAIEGGHTFDR